MKIDKPSLLLIRDPLEIAAVARGCSDTPALDDPIGAVTDKSCWAYKWSMERYRITAANKEDVT